MSTFFVRSNQVLAINGQYYIIPNYVTGLVAGPSDPQTVKKQIPTDGTSIVNTFWLVPKVQSGHVIGYTELVANNTSVKPTPDSVKVLRLRVLAENATYDIAIADTDGISTASPPNIFAYDANSLGGTLPVMPTVIVPFPIIQNDPTSSDGTNNTFTFSLVSNPLGAKYLIPAPWFNGVAGTPLQASDNVTTPGGFVTWANTHWSSYGTWANPTGDVITLVSAINNVTQAGFVSALNPISYCFNLTAFSTPALVNQIKFGTGNLISIAPFMLTDDPAILQAQLQNVLSQENTTYSSNIAHKLQVNCLYATPKLYANGVDVVDASAGVCS